MVPMNTENSSNQSNYKVSDRGRINPAPLIPKTLASVLSRVSAAKISSASFC